MKIKHLIGALILSTSLIGQMAQPVEIVSNSNLDFFMNLDINNDGHEDILATGVESNQRYFYYYQNDGTGSFNSELKITPPNDFSPVVRTGFAVPSRAEYGNGDLNGDGYPEVLPGNYILSFNGSSFSFLQFNVPAHVPFPTEMIDMNGNGLSALFSCAAAPFGKGPDSKVYFFNNNGSFNFSLTDSIEVNTSVTADHSGRVQIIAANLDADSDLELVAMEARNSGFVYVEWIESQAIEVSNNGLSIMQGNLFDNVNNYFDAADYNGDGYVDVLGGDQWNPAVFYGDAQGDLLSRDYVRPNTTYGSRYDSVTTMLSINLENSCQPEILFASTGSSSDNDTLSVFNRNSHGSFDIKDYLIAEDVVYYSEAQTVQVASIIGTSQDVLALSATGINLFENKYAQGTCSTSGVAKKSGNTISYQLYPNPVSSQLNIQVHNAGNWELKIYDQLGQMHVMKSFSTLATIDVSTFASGLYFPILINIENGEQVSLDRVLVQ
jgi:hypothetical protein